MSDPSSSWLPPSATGGFAAPHSGLGYPPQPFKQLPAPSVVGSYAPWGKRVAAALIDSAPALVGAVLFMVGYVQLVMRLVQFGSVSGLDSGVTWMVVGGVTSLLAFGWTVYDRWFGAGRGGQSVGKRAMRISLVSRQTGQPVGPTNACVRDLVHIVDGCACVGFLWPLWDDKRQTFADKIMDTAVIESSSEA